MKVENISPEEAKTEMEKRRKTGQWQELIGKVKSSGKPVKVSGITRGQIAALHRAATNAKLQVRANYKSGYCVVSP